MLINKVKDSLLELILLKKIKKYFDVSVQVSNLEELDGTINKLIKKLDTGEFQCTVCGKVNINYYPIRAHCEIHIMTSGFSCDICGRTLKTRNSLSVHKSLKHRFMDKYK